MKNSLVALVLIVSSLWSLPVFSQTNKEPEALGLPGDNLDLYAVLDIFQKSKTIEDFEKTLNDEKTAINNLDLDNDKKVDFIKVVTKKEGDDFTFILQDAVSKTETQDVAVILVSKDKDKKVTMQIVGDEDLYGKNYVVEPNTSTANPAYTGGQTETKAAEKTAAPTAQASTTTVVVESAPIVQYVYSPAYVPYYPPYYYGYYPPYYRPWVPIMFGIYWANHYHYHGGYHGSVYINNSHHYNNYSRERNRSNTVSNNMNRGDYRGTYGGKNYNRPSTGAGASTRPSTRPSTGASTRPSTRPSTGASTRPSTRPTSPSASTRQSSSNRQSASTRQSSSSSRPSSSYSGGGRTGGGGFSGGRGGFGGGGGRRR
jgi:uncharacterized membrane protein YgcG